MCGHIHEWGLSLKKAVEMVKSPRIKTISNKTRFKGLFRGVESLLL